MKEAQPREPQPRPELGGHYTHAGALRAAGRAIIDSAVSRIAIRIRGAVTPLQANLMRPLSFRPVDEEFWVEGEPPRAGGVELDHPAVDPFRIELRVDRAVERVGEINAPAVAADLHHLRSTIELAVLRTRVSYARHDASNPHL